MTPTNPQWVTDSVQGLGGKITDTFKNLDPYSLVPGADPLQTQAAGTAAGLKASPLYSQASDIFGRIAGAGPSNVQAGNVQAGDIASGIKGFMSPYTNDVVNTSLADYDQGAGYTRAQNQLSLAGDTTFGGSGGAIQTALSNGEIDRGRGSLAAGLRDLGFTRASELAARQAEMGQQASLANANFSQQASTANASLSEQALARQADAAQGLAGVAGAQGADTRANIGTQADIGAILRQIAAARAGAPIGALAAESGLIGGLPLDMFRGSNATGSLSGTTNTTQSGMDIGQLLQMAAGTGLMFVPGGQAAGGALVAGGAKG